MLIKDAIKRAKARGVPVVTLDTTDQGAALEQVKTGCNGKTAVVTYDLITGFRAANEAAEKAGSVKRILNGEDPITVLNNPTAAVSCLVATATLPDLCVVCYNAHKWINEPSPMQGVMLLRDKYKSVGSMIVLMGLSIVPPPEMTQDVYAVEDTLPVDAEREAIIREVTDNAGIKVAADDMIAAVAATRGLNAYAVEQITALSVSKDGLSISDLYSRWRSMINAVPGLTLNEVNTSLEQIGGLENFKAYARARMNGLDTPEAIIFIDEIEKGMAGSGGAAGTDSSGVSTGIMGTLLTFMQDNNAEGLIECGVPGSGKSLSATAMGVAGRMPVPTIRLDIGGLKGSLVGQSEANTRRALATIKAIASRTFWIATCNNEKTLAPELKRRFTSGTWFFDLPTPAERASIWAIYRAKYEGKGVDFSTLPNDTNWTGAEIRTCCEHAYRMRLSLVDASDWIVPVADMARDKIEALRDEADGKWQNASAKGAYRRNATATATPAPTGRKMNLRD